MLLVSFNSLFAIGMDLFLLVSLISVPSLILFTTFLRDASLSVAFTVLFFALSGLVTWVETFMLLVSFNLLFAIGMDLFLLVSLISVPSLISFTTFLRDASLSVAFTVSFFALSGLVTWVETFMLLVLFNSLFAISMDSFLLVSLISVPDRRSLS